MTYDANTNTYERCYCEHCASEGFYPMGEDCIHYVKK
jgi:hypothetical protein